MGQAGVLAGPRFRGMNVDPTRSGLDFARIRVGGMRCGRSHSGGVAGPPFSPRIQLMVDVTGAGGLRACPASGVCGRLLAACLSCGTGWSHRGGWCRRHCGGSGGALVDPTAVGNCLRSWCSSSAGPGASHAGGAGQPEHGHNPDCQGLSHRGGVPSLRDTVWRCSDGLSHAGGGLPSVVPARDRARVIPRRWVGRPQCLTTNDYVGWIPRGWGGFMMFQSRLGGLVVDPTVVGEPCAVARVNAGKRLIPPGWGGPPAGGRSAPGFGLIPQACGADARRVHLEGESHKRGADP